ncbi:hypothetical protein CORC01_05059 [Colletotrichum orchidophilum]|uniref:Uncharacterized protein n=1 Tax=Colletotrichum orchidophilum TaxID=1209926 RepID=A0A1G4BE73_9PEZI|nr:uncharacterized protein CORC01_05059 [Colletotrichum orchidophilum]OHE99701.1 hypothetical protein CORC01_05059 [Colletotrichum orchidophilum]
MRDLPASPRHGSPALAPRRLSEELGDFSFSSDEYDDDDEEEGDEEDKSYDGIETPASSRKSSQSLDGYFDEVDAYKQQQLQDTTSESERIEKKNDSRPSTATYSSRPSTAVSMPPFRRSSTCPVLPDDFISSAADEVVKIMPDQAAFMKRMVEGWREIQRRSSVSTTTSPMSPATTISLGTTNSPKRPHTAPSPMYAPQMCFASFPQAVPEQDEPDSPTESVGSFPNVVERLDKVEETLEELRDLAKQQAGAAIASTSASVTEQNAKFAVVNKCIDTIGKVCERELEEQQHDSQLDRRCVDALIQICEMFARESADQDPYRFGSSFMAEESEDDDVEYEGEDEEEDEADSESDGDSEYGSDDDYEAHPIDSDPTEYESGDFLGKYPTIETDKTLPPLSRTRRSSTPTQVAPAGARVEAPDTPRRRARLVREAKAELDALFSEWAEPKNSYEERHSRIVYATEAYHLRLVDMKSAHECEFKWKKELMSYEEEMKDRGIFGPNVWPIVDLALPIAQVFLSVTLLVAHFFGLDAWLMGKKPFLMFLAAWLASVTVLARCTEVKARETLYKTLLPPEAREMRSRHERDLVLLKAAHDRAVQRVYAPEQQSRAGDRSG